MADSNNVDVAAIMNMVAALSPEGSGVRKDVVATAQVDSGQAEPAPMPSGSGVAPESSIGARPAVAPAASVAPAALAASAARTAGAMRPLGSAGSLTADDLADAPAARRAEPTSEDIAAMNKRIVSALAAELGQPVARVEAVISLIDEGATIPFIARYRKEATGGMDDVALRALDDRLSYLRNLEQRKSDVIAVIDGQGKLTDELRESIEQAPTLQRVEDLYKPFRKKRATRASKARDAGLEPLANLILMQPVQGEGPLAAAA